MPKTTPNAQYFSGLDKATMVHLSSAVRAQLNGRVGRRKSKEVRVLVLSGPSETRTSVVKTLPYTHLKAWLLARQGVILTRGRQLEHAYVFISRKKARLAWDWAAVSEVLHHEHFHAIVLELHHIQHLGLLQRLSKLAPDIPIILVTASNKLAHRALHHGANDIVSRSEFSASTLARTIAYAIQRQEMQQKLLHLASVDQLTGLFNRRGFELVANTRLNRLAQGNKLGMVVALDLDHFKSINDRYGHAAGDATLQRFARVLSWAFPTALIARLGGDEFAVIAQYASTADVIHRLRLFDRQIKHSNRNQNITIRYSLGYVLFNPSGQIKLRPLLGQADSKLYQVKSANKS